MVRYSQESGVLDYLKTQAIFAAISYLEARSKKRTNKQRCFGGGFDFVLFYRQGRARDDRTSI